MLLRWQNICQSCLKSLTDATALAWDGIVCTDTFKNSTTFAVESGANVAMVTKQDLKDFNTSYVLKINGKGKELCR